MTNPDDFAFGHVDGDEPGLTVREWYAGLAGTGAVANLPWTGDDSYSNAVKNRAQKCVDMADAIIAALNRPRGEVPPKQSTEPNVFK